MYDYEQPPGQRAVYAGLDLEANAPPDLTILFSDYTAFNPHTLAAQRPNPYTRYVLVALARCFITYGDSEFTRGTTQSRSRARALYEVVPGLPWVIRPGAGVTGTLKAPPPRGRRW